MDREKYLLLIHGQDKTDSVASFQFRDGACDVIYANSSKVYHYQNGKVQLLKLRRRIDLTGQIAVIRGEPVSQAEAILDFGPYCRILRTGSPPLSCPSAEVDLQEDCLAQKEQKDTFHYLKETATVVSLKTDLGGQHSEQTV